MSPPGGAVAKLGCGPSALWSGDDGESEEFESRPSVIKSVINMAVQLLTLDHYVAVLIPHLIPQLCCSHLKSPLRRGQRAKRCQAFSPQGGTTARVQDTFQDPKKKKKRNS